MKILVTGATGFVGKPLTRTLASAGWQVVSATRRASYCKNEITIGNIDGTTQWQKALIGCNTVVHLAAHLQTREESAPNISRQFETVNTEGTLNLARQAAQAGVSRFVFLSTIKVNGESSTVIKPFRAEDTPLPSDNYALSKLKAEIELLRLAKANNMEVVIIRPPLVYGPGVKGNFESMINGVLSGIPLPFEAIQNKRSLIALENLIDFISLCSNKEKSPNAANEVFLISDNEDVSTPELLRKIARAYGVKARLFAVPIGWMQLGAKLLGKSAIIDRLLGSLVVDSSKARDVLDWQPVVTIDEQLRKMNHEITHF